MKIEKSIKLHFNSFPMSKHLQLMGVAFYNLNDKVWSLVLVVYQLNKWNAQWGIKGKVAKWQKMGFLARDASSLYWWTSFMTKMTGYCCHVVMIPMQSHCIPVTELRLEVHSVWCLFGAFEGENEQKHIWRHGRRFLLWFVRIYNT